MRVSVALFGLNRSLPWTHKSIERCLIQPLKQAGATVKIFAHFNAPQNLNNPRSGEKNGDFRNAGVERLKMDKVFIEPQRNEDTEDIWQRFKSHDLQSNDATGATHRNLINQYRSQLKVMQLIRDSEGDNLDAVLFARPDLEYLDPLPARVALGMVQSGTFDILTPAWHRWGGLNDRIALCNPRAAMAYASRLSLLDEIIRLRQPMNAERILMHTVQNNSLNNGDLPIRGVRVRYTGYPVNEGFKLTTAEQARFLCRRVTSKIRRTISI
jgi:hypothetical protein